MAKHVSEGAAPHAGFRFHRFEVLNWGTFHNSIWTIDIDGENSLFTGDIGSGKSTLVDGITTLLYPPNQITYNKAAGVETRERSLRSYILGDYKSEKDNDDLQARSVSLREKNSYSVLLAWFYNAGYEQGVTIAQVFWMRENKTQPDRFYVIGNRGLGIDPDFCRFGNDVLDLKKRLKGDPGVAVYDTFNEYAADLRRRFNMPNRQALDLFYQTVSMKSVGNLTEFVKNHMLDEPPATERVKDLCADFLSLNSAHEAVLKAKAQIGLLEPLVADCDAHGVLEGERRELAVCRDSLDAFFAGMKANLLANQIERSTVELARLTDRVQSYMREIGDLENWRERLRSDINTNGGSRIDELEQEIGRLERERMQKQETEQRYAQLCAMLELNARVDERSFYENYAAIGKKLDALDQAKEELQERQLDAKLQWKRHEERRVEIERELVSLRERPSNIPSRNLELRKRLCDTLEIPEDEVPFVGELLQVCEEEGDWEGAIERLLHGFGLSLLVPDALYARVARYVDKTNLRGRLIYYRVKADERRLRIQADAQALIHKLEIKRESVFYSWLERELAEHFNYQCCENLEEFARHLKAITRSGQLKRGGVRHEKDDRNDLHDRSNYVLGWRNESKIRILEERREECRRLAHEQASVAEKLRGRERRVVEQRDAARDLQGIKEWSELCWQPVALRIEEIVREKKRIEETTDILRVLKADLFEVEKKLAEANRRKNEKYEESVQLQTRMHGAQEALTEAQAVRDSARPETRDAYFPKLEKMREEAFREKRVTLQNCDNIRSEMRVWLQGIIDATDKRIARVREKITRQMAHYKDRYPQETKETDAALEAADEFRRMLDTLRREDLPRHEKRFRELLKERTIQGIALFQNQMEREYDQIVDKIRSINRSLRGIDYNPGSYITIALDRTTDREILDFRADLRVCMGDTLSGNDEDIYTEERFLRVKALIDRFNGRADSVELDRRWTKKVTDVRNWFIFSASERWIEDESEKEFYSDSSGKSGGQKEKLAYTILAAALAFQYGIDPGESKSRSFRFVMIDEAFGRGSDESTRYGLELFRKFNLQLLIITPLQKLHIIERYIRSVHFIYQQGNVSRIGSMSIEEYKKQQAQWEERGNGELTARAGSVVE